MAELHKLPSWAINKRVELLGRQAGIQGLAAHDCRHYDAAFEARNGTPINRIMDKFGWNSPAMALRYIEAAHIANEERGEFRSFHQLSGFNIIESKSITQSHT